MAATVRLRRPDTGEEIVKPKSAVAFFVNQGYKVLTSTRRRSTAAATAAQKEAPRV